jgi:hypothetical protein
MFDAILPLSSHLLPNRGLVLSGCQVVHDFAEQLHEGTIVQFVAQTSSGEALTAGQSEIKV